MPSGEHPLSRVWMKLARGEAIVAGVLSGTSADGIDVALVRLGVAGARKPIAFAVQPFPAALSSRVRAALDGAGLGARELAFLSRDLGLAFGRAATTLAAEASVELDLVGSHGQTVWHHDGVERDGRATLQIGDGDFVAAATGAVTVSDFRTADVALGGEGAPLSALCDDELFPDLPRPVMVLNLGGMANATLLREGAAPLAFDTGPANALLDGLARALLNAPYDRGGAVALRGRAHPGLLAELLQHPFFARRPPKSTGRDTFGAPWVARVSARAAELGLGAEDALATGVALVAESVAGALRQFLPGAPRALILCGGGARNLALTQELERRSALATTSSAEHGVDPDAREALVFALLAVRCVLARPSTEPEVTGARPGGVLGKLSFPPQEARVSKRADGSRTPEVG